MMTEACTVRRWIRFVELEGRFSKTMKRDFLHLLLERSLNCVVCYTHSLTHGQPGKRHAVTVGGGGDCPVGWMLPRDS